MNALLCRFWQLRGARVASILLICLVAQQPVFAESWVVLQARGVALKSGASLDGAAVLTLKEGEKLTAISPTGVSVTLKGPYSGPIAPAGGAASADAQKALNALVANRQARSNTVGVIRAGASASALPDPWLIDVSYPGPRCMREASTPVWWRPQTSQAADFTVLPVDRSWSMDFHFDVGQDRLNVPSVSRFEGVNVFFIRYPEQEFAISLNAIPVTVDNPLVWAAWMIEKGCQQQADALLQKMMADTQGQP